MTAFSPMRRPDDSLVFGFDAGCIGTARALIKLDYHGKQRDMLIALIETVAKITDGSQLEAFLKRLPEGNAADQLLTGHAVHILASMNRAPEQIVWNCLLDKDWSKSVFAQLTDMHAEHLFDGLNEIQLRNKGKWDEQLPHLYAFLCEELRHDKEKRKLLFAFTVISSLAADSVSAIDRLLKGRYRFDYREEVEQWRKKVGHTFPLVPEWCRARLRAVLASLHI